MEEPKHHHEHGCCSSKDKCHCPGMHIFVKFAIILVIFLLGICLGAKISSHENGREFNKNFRNQAGCPLMQGELNKTIINETATSTK